MIKKNKILSDSNLAIIELFKRGYNIDSNGIVYNSLGKIVKGQNTGEYLNISIRVGSVVRKIFIHRIQAFSKFGYSIFSNGIQVRHLNNNPYDNSFDNIEIGTPSQNMMDKSENTRKRCSLIATRKMQDSIRSYENRLKIYYDIYNGISYSNIMKRHKNLSKSTLSFMKNKSAEYIDFVKKVQNSV